MIEPKYKPILFTAPMVRAILEGRKTQTRRIVGQKHIPFLENINTNFLHGNWEKRPLPYGQPGDRLWVRESFIYEPADYCWEASVSIPCREEEIIYRADFADDTTGAGWSSGRYMPRNLSRITLEVTGVRVERLQDISEDDAIEEGIYEDHVIVGAHCNGGRHTEVFDYRFFYAEDGEGFEDTVDAYKALWDSINGPGSWEKNPWVWVIEFKRVED